VVETNHGPVRSSNGVDFEFYHVVRKFYGMVLEFYGAVEQFYHVVPEFYGVVFEFYHVCFWIGTTTLSRNRPVIRG